FIFQWQESSTGHTSSGLLLYCAMFSRSRFKRLNCSRTASISASRLTFKCPKSGRAIESGIEVSDAYSMTTIRMFSVRVRCPICAELHEFRVADGRFDGETQAA